MIGRTNTTTRGACEMSKKMDGVIFQLLYEGIVTLKTNNPGVLGSFFKGFSSQYGVEQEDVKEIGSCFLALRQSGQGKPWTKEEDTIIKYVIRNPLSAKQETDITILGIVCKRSDSSIRLRYYTLKKEMKNEKPTHIESIQTKEVNVVTEAKKEKTFIEQAKELVEISEKYKALIEKEQPTKEQVKSLCKENNELRAINVELGMALESKQSLIELLNKQLEEQKLENIKLKKENNSEKETSVRYVIDQSGVVQKVKRDA